MELFGEDSLVAALFSRLEEQQSVRKEKEEAIEILKAPKTMEEYLRVEGLVSIRPASKKRAQINTNRDWPLPLGGDEGALDVRSEGLFLGSPDDIMELLSDAAPLGLSLLDDLEDRLDELEEGVNYYSSRIIQEDEKKSDLPERFQFAAEKIFVTEISEEERKSQRAMQLHGQSASYTESAKETKKNTLQYCSFPGFRSGELVELPGQLEAPHIMHKVTEAQDFNRGFKKFWKKLFLSEASVAVMQDTFWWFFLKMFQKQKKSEQDQLYDRVADSFIALFTSINIDIKDKFLSAYPESLAQAIFLTFYEAFPESRAQFDDDFKQELINLVHEWTTGIKPMPQSYKKWRVPPPAINLPAGLDTDSSNAAKQKIGAAVLNRGVAQSLDIDAFEKMVEKMGADPAQSVAFPNPLSKDTTKVSTQGGTATRNTSAQSRVVAVEIPFKLPKESHQIGPGPSFEQVKFNTQGRSPLIAHYLHMRQLQDYNQVGHSIRRTEISKLPSPGPTYRQVIENALILSETMSKEYQRVCEQTNQDILQLEKRQIETNQSIRQLKKELLYTKNALDLKILSERIMGLKDRERDPHMSVQNNVHQSSNESDADDDEDGYTSDS